MNDSEPASDEAVAAWIEARLLDIDPFLEVAEASDKHREEHGCDTHPSRTGHLLAGLAASVNARRILEIGGGLGYSTLWLAHGGGPDAIVETIEADPTHAALLGKFAERFGLQYRIKIHLGRDDDILPSLQAPFDLIFYDAFIPGPDLADRCELLLRRGGVLIASNIFLGRYIPAAPDLARGAAFREKLLTSDRWFTSFANGKLLAVRR